MTHAAPTPSELQAYLHAHIPLSAAMDVRVLAVGPPELVLAVPLAPNLNHRGTAFGGSLVTAAILAGWSWLHVALRREGVDARLVIQRQEMEYLSAVEAGFEAACAGPALSEFARFLQALRARGRARTTLLVEVRCGGALVGRFSGDFVALAR